MIDYLQDLEIHMLAGIVRMCIANGYPSGAYVYARILARDALGQ